MVLHVCQNCTYHEMVESDTGPVSHCRKENCWSQYSKCVAHQAIDYFLTHQHEVSPRSVSSVEHMYEQL